MMFDTLQHVIESLYASEINFGMQSFWDGGMSVWVGGDTGKEGYKTEYHIESDKLSTIGEVLIHLAVLQRPDSKFAKQFSKKKDEEKAQKLFDVWRTNYNMIMPMTECFPSWSGLSDAAKSSWIKLAVKLDEAPTMAIEEVQLDIIERLKPIMQNVEKVFDDLKSFQKTL